MSLTIETRGLDALQSFFAKYPETVDQALVFAINDTARFARRLASKEVRDQVAFRASDLGNDGDSEAGLGVSEFASSSQLEAVVRGRDRVKSLAGFATTPVKFGRQKGVRVRVSKKKGGKRKAGMFFVRLKRGTADVSSEEFNVGLAIRLKPGESVHNKYRVKKFGAGIYLLYGPSIAQVFDDVALAIEPRVSNELEFQFVRQMARRNRG